MYNTINFTRYSAESGQNGFTKQYFRGTSLELQTRTETELFPYYSYTLSLY